MKILIVGFQEYETLDNIMQKLIESGQCYIFTVLCGGCEYSEEKSLAEQWAINNGAPIEYIYEKDERWYSEVVKYTYRYGNCEQIGQTIL